MVIVSDNTGQEEDVLHVEHLLPLVLPKDDGEIGEMKGQWLVLDNSCIDLIRYIHILMDVNYQNGSEAVLSQEPDAQDDNLDEEHEHGEGGVQHQPGHDGQGEACVGVVRAEVLYRVPVLCAI